MRARLVALATSLTLVSLLVLVAPLQASSGPGAAPGERAGKAQPVPTGWEWWVAQTPAFIGGKVTGDHMRILDLEVASVSPLKLTVSMVSNTGAYASGWYWYYDQSYTNVVNFLATHTSQRLIDLETYVSGGVRKYAFVTQTNSPSIGWWWYVGQTTASISAHLSANHARLVDIDRYTSGGSTYYLVIMVDNTGANATGWWYWYNLTPSQIADKINQEGSRLIAIEPGTPGRFIVILVKSHGEYWWWYPKVTASYAGKLAAQNAARIYEIEPYVSGGSTWYAVVMINNANATTTTVRELMRPAGQYGGTWGFYLKQVSPGGVVANLEETFSFEPASMIKVVHFLTALRKVHNGDFALTDTRTWYVNPANPARYPGQTNYGTDKNVCAYDSNGNLITTMPYSDTVSTILAQMMQQSDNRATDATLGLDGGFAAVNGTISTFGLTGSHIDHRIGCPRNAVGNVQPWKDNRFTLVDAGKIYEGYARNLVGLDDTTTRNAFHDLMLNETNFEPNLKNSLYPIVKDEAAKHLSKPLNDPAVTALANDFWDEVVWQAKGGSYDFCGANGCNSSPETIYRTGGGLFQVPTRARGGLVHGLRKFVFGTFLDSSSIPCAAGSKPPPNGSCTALKTVGDAMSAAGLELYRTAIHSAMTTWPT